MLRLTCLSDSVTEHDGGSVNVQVIKASFYPEDYCGYAGSLLSACSARSRFV